MRRANFTPKQLERIRYMKANGMSNQEIARVMGVHMSTISAYIRGERGKTKAAQVLTPGV